MEPNTSRREESSTSFETHMGKGSLNLQNEQIRKTTQVDDINNVQQSNGNDVNKTLPDRKIHAYDTNFDGELDPLDKIIESDAGYSDAEDSAEILNDQEMDQVTELEEKTTSGPKTSRDYEKENDDVTESDNINEKQDEGAKEGADSILDDESTINPLKRIYKKFRPRFKIGETFDIFMSDKILYKGVTEVTLTQVLTTNQNKGSDKLKENKEFKVKSRKSGYRVDFSEIKDDDIVDVKLKPSPKSLQVTTVAEKTAETIVFNKDSDGKYVCSECGKTFVEKHGLILHMRSHTGERPYKCQYCEKAYTHGSHLKDHVLSHHTPGYRPHVCEICGKGFPLAARLRSHQRIHDKDRPCKCEDCGKTFARIELLRQHIAFKKRGYDFVCELCGHKFRQNDSLKTHMLTKHGEPQFQCKYCDKKFFKKKNFTTHVNNHLGIHKYSCDCCGIAFSCQSALRRHYRRKSTQNRGKRKPKLLTKEQSVEEDMEINDLWDME